MARKRHQRMQARSTFERLMLIYALLRFPGREVVNCSRLAKRLETSTKTIHRDIEFLRDRIGMPIYYDAATFSYRTDPKARLPWVIRDNEREVGA